MGKVRLRNQTPERLERPTRLSELTMGLFQDNYLIDYVNANPNATHCSIPGSESILARLCQSRSEILDWYHLL